MTTPVRDATGIRAAARGREDTPVRGRIPLRRLAGRAAAAAAYVAVAVACWALYVSIAHVPIYLLPSPGQVWSALIDLARTGQLLPNLGYTCRNIAFGFTVGSIIGVALGWLLWASRAAREIVAPYIVLLQAAPKIAVAPLLVLWFGLNLTSQLALILLLVFFPMMLATLLGLAQVPADLDALARLLRLSGWERLRLIQLPAAAPALFAGAKVAIVDAMTGAFLAEYLSAQKGLGYLMVAGDTSFNTPMLVAAVLLTVIVGLLGFALVSLAERWMLRWQY